MLCVSVDYPSSLKISNLNAAHAHLTVFASARTMGAYLQLKGDEGGDPKRKRTDDSNSEESVVSDSSDENRFGVRYKGHSTNNVGATQELYQRWTINRRCKVWKPHRNRTNDFPSTAVANAKAGQGRPWQSRDGRAGQGMAELAHRNLIFFCSNRC